MSDSASAQAWVTGARDGDNLAVSKLLASYHPALHARVQAKLEPALRSRFEPEDILQQVYLHVFQEVHRFQGSTAEAFLAWVTTIVDNKLIDVRRAAHRQVRDVARETPAAGAREKVGADSYWNLLDYLYDDATTPSRICREEEAVGAMLTCIASLSDAHRQIIQLRFLDGLSVADVAQRLDKTEAAVVAMTKRALEALRKGMDRLGDFTRGG